MGVCGAGWESPGEPGWNLRGALVSGHDRAQGVSADSLNFYHWLFGVKLAQESWNQFFSRLKWLGRNQCLSFSCPSWCGFIEIIFRTRWVQGQPFKVIPLHHKKLSIILALTIYRSKPLHEIWKAEELRDAEWLELKMVNRNSPRIKHINFSFILTSE